MTHAAPVSSSQDGRSPALCLASGWASVSVLFARRDSVYKTLGADVWDADRDALNWAGGNAVITHPPCRAWGRLAHFANPPAGEKELAPWAVGQVRRWGGVLEHPERSRLWQAAGLPLGNRRDSFGGFTLAIDQRWWGHRANKPTWLYVCGISPADVPEMPLRIDEGTHYIMRDNRNSSRNAGKAFLPKAEREHTPPALAEWLLTLASRCRPNTTVSNPARAGCESKP